MWESYLKEGLRLRAPFPVLFGSAWFDAEGLDEDGIYPRHFDGIRLNASQLVPSDKMLALSIVSSELLVSHTVARLKAIISWVALFFFLFSFFSFPSSLFSFKFG